jgi:hypothetical protein
MNALRRLVPLERPRRRICKFVFAWAAIIMAVIKLARGEFGDCYAFALIAMAIGNAPGSWRY